MQTIELPPMQDGVRDLLEPYGIPNQVWDAVITPSPLQFYTNGGLTIRVNRGTMWAETAYGDARLTQGNMAVLCEGPPATLLQHAQGVIPPAQITFAYLDTADLEAGRTKNLWYNKPPQRLITERLICSGIRLHADGTRVLQSARTPQFMRAWDGSAKLQPVDSNQIIPLDGLEIVRIDPGMTVTITAGVNGAKIDLFTLRR